jgi:formylglycine-generating enzyme required for sulfatase activity
MIEIPAGRFAMGSTGFYAEEGPVREVEVDAFAIDAGPVSVAVFERFTADTGYVTVAERPPDPADYPDADPALLVEGSAVFHPTRGPVPLDNPGPGRGCSPVPPRRPARAANTTAEAPVIAAAVPPATERDIPGFAGVM